MASWVTPLVQAVGDILTAAIWNQNVVNNSLFIYERPYMLATGGSQTIASAGTGTQFNLNDPLISNYGPTLSSNALELSPAGLWLVRFTAEIQQISGGSSSALLAYMNLNGSSTVARNNALFNFSVAGGNIATSAAQTIGTFAAGDLITAIVSQQSGASVTLEAGTSQQSHVEAFWLGPA